MRRQLAALVLALSLPLPSLAAQVVIQPGETLSEIAARAGISTQRLMQLNGIRDANRIVAGQKLTVPGPQRPGVNRQGTTAAGGRITIRKGETLSEISDRYGVSVDRLMQLNGISDPTRVVAGDTLILRAPSSNRGNRGGGGGGNRPSGGGTTVTIRPGDTLSEIADRYKVSVERLVQLNRLQNPGQLIAGDKLVISTRPPTRPNRPTQTAAGARVYVVQPGDTLSEIATDHKVPVERLVSLNKLKDPDDLLIGTQIRLTAPPPVPRTTPRPTSRPRPKVTPAPVARTTPARPPATTAAAPTRSTSTAAAATTAAKAGTGTTRTTATSAATPARATEVAARPTTNPTVQTTTTTPAAATPTQAAAATPTKTTVAAASAATAGSPSGTGATAATTTPATTTAVAAAATATAATPATTRTATTTVATASQRPTTTTSSGTTTRPRAVAADWRTYGPMQVDWASWQTMGGSYVAPVLTGTGQPFYLAINCGARKLNTTGPGGQWKTWDSPQTEFEQSLVTDLCRLKAS